MSNKNKLLGFLGDKIARNDMLEGGRNALMRGAFGAFGAPVDMLTIGMRPFGYNVPDAKVVGSSEWLGKQAENMGLVSGNRNAFAELMSGMLSPDPMDALKFGSAILPVVGKAVREKIPKDIGFHSWSLNRDQIWDPVEEDLIDGDEYILIDKIYVNPEYRNQGYGKKLLDEALAEIKAEHPRTPIKLVAMPDSGPDEIELEDLVKFYEKNGFSVDESAANMDGVVMDYYGF